MKGDNPFQKSFVCASILLASLVILMGLARVEQWTYRSDYVVASCMVSGAVSGVWGHFSVNTWTWLRAAVTAFGFYLLLAVLYRIYVQCTNR